VAAEEAARLESALRAVPSKIARPGRENSIPAEQENVDLWLEPSSVSCLRLNSWRGTQSHVFTTPYAPAVRTPTAHVLTNPLVEHAKTTTKAANGAFTAVQVPVREIMTNHGVALSLIRIRTV
jgi:hypothetical protein